MTESIATADVADTIPGPLLDRMEVIGFDGYTTSEKVAIARGYLWPRQLKRNGLRPEEVDVDDGTLELITTEYTREVGVPPAGARPRDGAAQDGDPDRIGDEDAAGRDRHRRGA